MGCVTFSYNVKYRYEKTIGRIVVDGFLSIESQITIEVGRCYEVTELVDHY